VLMMRAAARRRVPEHGDRCQQDKSGAEHTLNLRPAGPPGTTPKARLRS
jgi:hypothetical protein